MVVWAYAKQGLPAAVTLFEAVALYAPPLFGRFDAQHFSNMLWAFAKVEHPALPLFDAAARALTELLVRGSFRCKPQNLSIILYAFAKAAVPAAALFQAAQPIAVQLFEHGEMTPQNASNCVWAYAKAGEAAPTLFLAAERWSVGRFAQFDSSQNLTMFLWSFATAEQSTVVFERAAPVWCAYVKAGTLVPQDVSLVAWSYAKARVQAPAVFDVVAQHLSCVSLTDWLPQNLTNSLWSLATAIEYRCMGSEDARPAFMAGAAAASRMLERYNLQDLSNTAWAFARAGCPAPDLFDAMIPHALRALAGISWDEQGASNLVWAYATVGVDATELFRAVERMVLSLSVCDMKSTTTQAIANILWAFAKAGEFAPQIFEKLATAAHQRLAEFESRELSSVVWAHVTEGTLGSGTLVCTAPLLDAVAQMFVHKLDGFATVMDVAILAWSYATAMADDVAEEKASVRVTAMLRAMVTRSTQMLADSSPQDLSSLLWAFAKLDHPAESLFDAAGPIALRQISAFRAFDVSMLMYAYAKANAIVGEALFGAMALRAVELLHDFTTQQLAWSCGRTLGLLQRHVCHSPPCLNILQLCRYLKQRKVLRSV